MSKRSNGFTAVKTEKNVICRNCTGKIPVKMEKDERSYSRPINCPHCGTVNLIHVDQNGRIHGPSTH